MHAKTCVKEPISVIKIKTLNNLMNRAIQAVMTYGSLHAAVRLPALKTPDYKRDALFGTKVSALMMSTCFAPTLFPIYIYNDMNRFHMYVNKIDPKLYGYETEFNDVTGILFN